MKKFFLMATAIFISLVTYAQEAKKETEAPKTKMDVFASKTGVITKFVDTNLPNLKTSYGVTQTRIRQISNGSSSAFFYQIEKEGKYGSTIASIEYTDLIEILKAIKVLKTGLESDTASNPDYMENKFTTADGFQLGYYVKSGKATWYIKLEKFGSDNTIFVSDGDVIEQAFSEAKNKIDELKK